MITHTQPQSGFSLVETLVAITILLIIIIGPMTIVSNAARGTSFSGEQVVGYFLAQEGAELAQKARDDVLLPFFSAAGTSNQAWNTYSDSSGSGAFGECFTGGCGLEIETDEIGSVSVVDCNSANDLSNCRLYYDDTSNERARYTHTSSGNDNTVYTRVITMTEVGAREIEVVSTVTWRTDGQNIDQTAQVTTYLYNVYGR